MYYYIFHIYENCGLFGSRINVGYYYFHQEIDEDP